MIPPNPTAFTWQRHSEAEQLVRKFLNDLLGNRPEALKLSQRMRDETGTRFIDWVDHLAIQGTDAQIVQLRAAGFIETPVVKREPGWPSVIWMHPGGVFPRIAIHRIPQSSIAIRVESIADFAAAMGLELRMSAGAPFSPCRWLPAGHLFQAVERHGYTGFGAYAVDPANVVMQLHHAELLRTRARDWWPLDEVGFQELNRAIDRAISDLGPNLTTDLFFTAEREYWQRRNRAAQFQKSRQDKLGLGWANHDHHTYRSSRRYFPKLIALWEKLGFTLRERFYAGAQAGWGAQICEHPVCGIVTFNDVDLSPDELTTDFSHDPLPERNHLGTVGLWCALHGESILQAGMHHLECQFDFDALKQQLESDAGIKVMKPFTDLPHLRQAFTEGERWPVDPKRIDALLAANQITQEQAQTFRTHGAIGSHLENLERNEGFKGFNQTGVSDIIARTDPRLLNTPSPKQ